MHASAAQEARDTNDGVVVKYVSPDAAEDMPDLVGMRVTMVQHADVTTLSLEEVDTLAPCLPPC